MMPRDPWAFAKRWEAAWNGRDLEAVLDLFHDDATFSSPYGASVVPGSGGIFRGKAELRAYWLKGLEALPDLRFAVESVFAGVDAIVLEYRNQRDVRVCEVLVFDDGLVRSGHGTYLDRGLETGTGEPSAVPSETARSPSAP